MNQTHQGTSIIKLIKENLEIATRPKQKHMIYKNKKPVPSTIKLENNVLIVNNRLKTPQIFFVKSIEPVEANIEKCLERTSSKEPPSNETNES